MKLECMLPIKESPVAISTYTFRIMKVYIVAMLKLVYS